MSNAGPRILEQLQIIFINVNTVRQQWFRFENAVIAQVAHRRCAGGLPIDAARAQSIRKWTNTTTHELLFACGLSRVHHDGKFFVVGETRNHLELGRAHGVRRVR